MAKKLIKASLIFTGTIFGIYIGVQLIAGMVMGLSL